MRPSPSDGTRRPREGRRSSSASKGGRDSDVAFSPPSTPFPQRRPPSSQRPPPSPSLRHRYHQRRGGGKESNFHLSLPSRRTNGAASGYTRTALPSPLFPPSLPLAVTSILVVAGCHGCSAEHPKLPFFFRRDSLDRATMSSFPLLFQLDPLAHSVVSSLHCVHPSFWKGSRTRISRNY